MWTWGNTMTAAQKRGLCSSTAHMIQKYWASSLSKGSLVDTNSCYKEKHNTFNNIWGCSVFVFNISNFLCCFVCVFPLFTHTLRKYNFRLWSSGSLNSHMPKSSYYKVNDSLPSTSCMIFCLLPWKVGGWRAKQKHVIFYTHKIWWTVW